jgi:hypothetical protein
MKNGIVICLLLVLGSSFALGQAEQPKSPSPDLAALQSRIDELEQKAQRVDALESKVQELQQKLSTGTPAASVTSANGPAEAASEENAPASPTQSETTFGVPTLHLRAFGQAGYSASDVKGSRPAAAVGNLTLLMTSRLSDRFSVLGEVAFVGSDQQKYNVGIERLLLQYKANEHFKLSAGRYFTSIGYYNTAYYYADWAQTATTRPLIFRFPDQGGFLPTQRIGLSATGQIGSDKLGLHYIAEIGTGDVTRSNWGGPDVTYRFRAGYNFGAYIKPEKLQGLQIGGSAFHNKVEPGPGLELPTNVSQNIYAAYVVFTRPRWEFLNEAVYIKHTLDGTPVTYNTNGMYSLLSYKLTKSVRPYFRYDYVNQPEGEGLLPRTNGPTFGARYDFNEWIGFKGEYTHTDVRGSAPANTIGSQLVFTF